ncbi:MAG: ATP-binding protein [Thermoplasmata archaeon]|nr:ATP-binding protein [Thermoplasmata archaeon]
MSTILRDSYLDELMSYRKNTELIKVLTGIRRCGKSVILEQFRSLLVESGVDEKSIIYLNLEESRYTVDSERALYDYLDRNVVGRDPIILLDEVQLVKGWERAVDSIHVKHGADIYITGSNSETVSESLGTHLTGRFLEIHVFPFSFKEFLKRYPVTNDTGYTQRLIQFLRFGGMPILDLNDDWRKNRIILRGVYDSIINYDIRPKMELDQSILDELTRFMLSNIGNITSVANIAKGSFVGDQRTVDKYLSKLCGCFIFYNADRYDVIGKEHLRTKAKYYLADTGFREAILTGSEYNEGALLENAVYIELLRRGYKVSVGSYKGKEIDFTAWSDAGPEFYQVCWSMTDEKTRKREFDPLVKLDGKRYVITMDRDPPVSPEGVEIIDAVDFFLS